MSARTETLLEQINRLKSHVVVLEESGQDPHSLRMEIVRLEKELLQANQMLTESKVMKG